MPPVPGGIVFYPLAHSVQEKQEALTLISQEIEAEKIRIEAENRALIAALGWQTASSKLALQAEGTDLREAEYRDRKVRYEAGEISLEEVRTALRDWSAAQSLLGTARDAVIKAETELAAALGTRDFSLAPLETAEVQAELAGLQKDMTVDKASAGSIPSVRQDQINLSRLEEELKDTWFF